MKFLTQLVTAVLLQNGVEPVNVEVKTRFSLEQPIEDCSLSIYCKISQLAGFLPGYIATFKESVLAFDVELELQQLLSGAEVLCDEYESLEYISVWLELHREPQRQRDYRKSCFGLSDAQCELANQMTHACEPNISQMASSWLLHIDAFMRYVRNTLSLEMQFILSLFDDLHQIALSRSTPHIIKTVTHGPDVLTIELSRLNSETIEGHLRNNSPVSTRKSAADYIRRIQSFAHTGGRLGYVTCRHFRSGEPVCRSLPAFLRNRGPDSDRKQLNRLIADTVGGRNQDIGLCDF
ncbi:hypothetical protein I7V28_19520 [Lelliottia amnigena]|uniref:hypothetical protein n=1 Tax=Lelliottia TaxID=1330545 RepID=UPI00192BD46E|nr:MULTISPECIES: hypothetical protein [Lelliottia]MBL5885693.1 hypothetical protein [Lelliottia aquatilis]MBL5923272.1 hypothetical protein [Lelliottia amnigena]MBL5932181.1 hypothetical protein [Lelliottia amnigena]